MSRIRRQDMASCNSMMRLLLQLLLSTCLASLVESAFTTAPNSQRRYSSPAFVVAPQQQQSLTSSTTSSSLSSFSSASRSKICLYQSTSSSATVSGEAESIFQKSCDKDGLMTKDVLEKLDFITELLEDGDLMKDELEDMWSKASKGEEQIDIDSFVQIYRDIDDLFEDDEEEEEEVDLEAAAMAEIEAANSIVEEEETAADDKSSSAAASENDEELVTIFKSICSDEKLLTKESLSKWDEVTGLMEDGLFDENEFNDIWDKMPKTDGQLDLVGFLKFNSALDDLFDFDDEELEEEGEAATAATESSSSSKGGMVDDIDLTPAALYEALADADGLIGMPELKRWGELQEMIEEGELMPTELENFFGEISDKQSNKLNRDGFLALYDKIDSLFEDDDDEEGTAQASPQAPAASPSSAIKAQLLATVTSLNQDEERLPCGLESTESEQRYVKELVTELEGQDTTNQVRIKQGAIEMSDLAGTWELLYSSSSAMAYNKGLSGLGGSFPNGSFGGLKMKLVASKYLTDVEYTERIKVVPDTASFDVTVNGNWDLRSSVSIFTGEPSIVLTVVPGMVTYGPTSTRADHWKSLGPTNMLDLTYLDDDLRIMRGNTSTESILIFKKTS